MVITCQFILKQQVPHLFYLIRFGFAILFGTNQCSAVAPKCRVETHLRCIMEI